MEHPDGTSARIHDWLTRTFPLARKREVGLHDSLLETGIIDSLGTLEIAQYLEGEFGIQLTDEEMLADHFESIDAMAQLVDAKRREHSGDVDVS